MNLTDYRASALRFEWSEIRSAVDVRLQHSVIGLRSFVDFSRLWEAFSVAKANTDPTDSPQLFRWLAGCDVWMRYSSQNALRKLSWIGCVR